MSDSLRKGWCPGALRPMAAKDGLLVRLRITGGILPAATADALADLATRHGNGLFDLSARGNLQMRGVRETSLDALHDGLRALDLLDRDAATESVRNVMASPLAGCHDGIDIRPLVVALEQRLVADAGLHALPGKFGFLIDDGSLPSLAHTDADVRFDWIEDNGFAIGLAGTREEAIRIGVCDPIDLVARVARIAQSAVTLFARLPDGRRMRDLVAAFGEAAVRDLCGSQQTAMLSVFVGTTARDVVGQRTFAGVSTLGLAAPFGRLDALMLRAAAGLAARTPTASIRLTPWRTLLMPGASSDTCAIDGFITNPADPRLAIAACVGAEGCARGSTATHADATRLAATAFAQGGAGLTLHVSGCAKGCAKPSPSPFTLVARDGRYDLVRDGRAGDAPERRGLDLAAVCSAMLEPA